MKPYQFVGKVLNGASSVTAIVGTRISFGTRFYSSALSALPCINYYELSGPGRFPGVGSKTFTINCRAKEAATAKNLAEIVNDIFSGSSGTGMYGNVTGFSVIRTSVSREHGLIPEPEDNVHNAPVDILITYPLDTVS